MDIYIYLYLWALAGCFIGVVLGFFTAALMANSSHRETIELLKDTNDDLTAVATRLEVENNDLNTRLNAIKETVNKYFPER